MTTPQLTWFRVNITYKTRRYVDWYLYATQAEAEDVAREDMHRYGVPQDAGFAIRAATPDEARLLA